MKTILLPIIFLFCIARIDAQTNYYNVTKTFNENGYIYQCDVDNGSKFVNLYNKDNKLTYVEMLINKSGELYFPSLDTPDTFENDTWTKAKCYSIVNNAFSTAEKQRLKGQELSITLYISPDTGKIMEVNFNFITVNPFASIPVSVYRNIEMQLKKDIWFTPTAEGKKLNYLFLNWSQEAK